MGVCTSCFDFAKQRPKKQGRKLGATSDRERFEKTVRFLASVPLFRRKLPRAELPLVAQELEERTWAPGEVLVRQGEIGNVFFLVVSGRASVLTSVDGGEPRESGNLGEGDWLGGHTLMEERANVATVVASGPGELVTLSMSKVAFQTSGLSKRLQCPKRPVMRGVVSDVAVCLGARRSASGSMLAELGDQRSEEQAFILAAIRKNKNLRAFCARLSDEATVAEAVAKDAERRQVKAGEVLAEQGSIGQEFFILREGEVEVAQATEGTTHSHRTAEQVASANRAAERLRRKETFMLQLAQNPANRTRSLFAGRTERLSRPQGGGRLSHTRGTGGRNRAASNETPMFERAVSGEQPASQEKMRVHSNAETLITSYREGESFGELSLLYNTRREATFVAKVDSVVYVVSRRQFKQLAGRRFSRRVMEYAALLDEVDVLAPLLRSELRELAANVSDCVSFRPGQRVLTQGQVQEKPRWFVILRGTAAMTRESAQANSQASGRRGRMETVSASEIGRGGHFGARSLIADNGNGKFPYDINVDAGASGLTCVTFDGELVAGLLKVLFKAHYGDSYNGGTPGLEFNFEAKALRGRSKCQATLADLEEECVLGKGGFGCVMLVTDKSTGSRYALKRISKGHVQAMEGVDNLCWERDLLYLLDSRFVDSLYKTFRDEQFVYFLLEPALGGNIYQSLTENPEVFLEDRGSCITFVAACVLEGLEHLHQRKIAYRDLKLENVMLDTDGYGKLCDMGLARFVVGKTFTQVGTPDYMAPELIDPPHDHDCRVDYWALGVFCYELACGQTPFDDDGLEDAEERLLAIRRNQESMNLQFSFTCPAQVKSFIIRLLRPLSTRLGSNGGVEEIRGHSMFVRPAFDFEALRQRSLPSPLAKPWSPPEEPLLAGLHSPSTEEDDIFVQYPLEGKVEERLDNF